MGRYGPTQKPGLIHFLCGFDEEKNLRKITSMIHPMMDPEKKRNAKIKKNIHVKLPLYYLFQK